jgi:tetratricopeptide (TPR) repeat protein
VEKDPLRGHAYMAVGHFLIGAHTVLTEDIGGVTQALGKLRPIFKNLSKAEKISAQDPELNLIRGYMDLMLAVNLPFANPDEAIKRMEEYGKPSYVAYRGIAIGYRDLEKADKARKYVDKALAIHPDNPDLLYLKAQILLHQGEKEKSLQYFQAALARRSQLLPQLGRQIAYEHCRLATDLADRDRSVCHRLLD